MNHNNIYMYTHIHTYILIWNVVFHFCYTAKLFRCCLAVTVVCASTRDGVLRTDPALGSHFRNGCWCISQCVCEVGEGNGTPLQYSWLENPMDGGAWWAAVHGVAKSRTRLSDFTFTFHLHALEKEMATHSSVLAWRIPGMGEPGGLPSMGSRRVRHDWSDLAAAVCEVNVVNTFNSRIFFKEDLFFISKFDLEVFNTRNKLQTSSSL